VSDTVIVYRARPYLHTISHNMVPQTVVNPFALDGTPVDGNSGSSDSFALPGLSTTYGNVIVYCYIVSNGGPVTGVTSSGLTWAMRAEAESAGPSEVCEIWYAKSASALSNHVITVATTTAAFITAGACAFSGANFESPFDGNAAIPKFVDGNASTVDWTTTSADDILIGAARATIASPTAGAGFTQLLGANFTLAQYKIVAAPQSALSFTFGSGAIGGGSVADAIVKA
jgi:hypothetical protein